MQKARKKTTKRRKAPEGKGLDAFLPPKPEEKPKPKPPHKYKAIPGTAEWYQEIYMIEGVKTMMATLRRQYPKLKSKDFQRMINYILFGTNKDGSVRTTPQSPDPKLMTSNIDLYRFQERIYNRVTR